MRAIIVALVLCVAACSALRTSVGMSYPTGKYAGSNGPWYSSVIINSHTSLDLRVGGPHGGQGNPEHCKDVAYIFNATTGEMKMPDSFGHPKSCISELRVGNNGVMTLTFTPGKNGGSILLGVEEPSTDVTMTPVSPPPPPAPTPVPGMMYPTENVKYYGTSTNGWQHWTSSVIVQSHTELTLHVSGPHGGNGNPEHCKNVAYILNATNGDMTMPESFGNLSSCIAQLRIGNNGVMTLTFTPGKNGGSILLGVRDPGTDITMIPPQHSRAPTPPAPTPVPMTTAAPRPAQNSLTQMRCPSAGCASGCQNHSFPTGQCIPAQNGGSAKVTCTATTITETIFSEANCAGQSQSQNSPANTCEQAQGGGYLENVCNVGQAAPLEQEKGAVLMQKKRQF